jgi:hypothetical protein
MRLRKAKIISAILFICLGTAALAVAFFAFQLGLDNNAVMGSKRKLLVFTGVLLILLPALALFFTKLDQRWRIFARLDHFWVELVRSKPAGWLAAAKNRTQTWKIYRFQQRHPEIWAALAALLVIFIALWYITSGTLTSWTPYSRYFDRQADAFLAHQLALLEQPPKELLALTNPYDYRQRTGLSYLWDASLYQGQYYLYWGPVPALLAVGIKWIHPGVVEDQTLLFIFFCGFIVSLASLLHWLRKTYFQPAPGWTVLLFTLVGGLATPVFWLVNRPSVYETAIAAAQCFLILGLYAALRGLNSAHRGWLWLLLAGFSWSAAAGSRVNVALAIIFMTGILVFYLLRKQKALAKRAIPLISLLFPLAICAAGLAWYNFARFGSLLETGHRYQLTGIALPTDYRQIVSLEYIPPNLYSALIRPFEFEPTQFPFVFSPYISSSDWPNIIHLSPLYYYSEPISGVLLTIPIFWLLLLPGLNILRAAWRWLKEIPPVAVQTAGGNPPKGLWIIILGGAFFTFLPDMVFISSSMRYLADFVPFFTILTAMCLWWAYGFFVCHPAWKRILLLLAVVLVVITLLLGLLINFHNGDKRFEANNPALYAAIARFFDGAK